MRAMGWAIFAALLCAAASRARRRCFVARLHRRAIDRAARRRELAQRRSGQASLRRRKRRRGCALCGGDRGAKLACHARSCARDHVARRTRSTLGRRRARGVCALSPAIDGRLAMVAQGRRILSADLSRERRHRLDEPLYAHAVGDEQLGRRRVAHDRRRSPTGAAHRFGASSPRPRRCSAATIRPAF